MRGCLAVCLCVLSAACSEGGDPTNVPSGDMSELQKKCAAVDRQAGIERPGGWAALSHCKFAPADVARVFPIETIGKLTLSMTAADYAAMQADLAARPVEGDDEEDLIAACATLTEGTACATSDFEGHCTADGDTLACLPDDDPAPIIAENPCAGKDDGDACRQGKRTGACTKTSRLLVCQADGFDAADLSGEYDDASQSKPKYFHADVEYADARWTNVGIRYKGNNSLESAVGEKLPLRIKADKWEDEDKAVTNQRFFGFRELSLSPNQTDPTNLHQVLAAEAFRDAGVPAPYSSFVEVYLDAGSGPRLLGLYTMTEFPDDRLPRRVFGEGDGNMYKPDGRGAHFVEFVAASMDKRNNEGADYQDVQDFIAALHGSQRDRAAWRAQLSKTFDIAGFAKAYAVNQAVANFDTYGVYAHNFYLYNRSGALTFLPWDFDYAFNGTDANDVSLWSFGGEWPLLQALASDAELFTIYTDALADFADAQLKSGKLAERADTLAALIRPALQREDEVRPGVLEMFDITLPDLKNHLKAQEAAIAKLLAPQDSP